MIYFNCDYNEGCHPNILARLNETNMDQHIGYSEDDITAEAKALIKKACGREDIDVHILVGGTQTNMTVISSCLRPYQGVISSSCGHINRHEVGTIEAHGHKVLAIPEHNGKITAQQIADYCKNFYEDESMEHIVMPGMVYLSQPTEMGTIYSRRELEEIRKVCNEYDLYMYIDGARLGYGMASEGADFDLPFLCSVCDAFYIGGTKQGALFGEAVILVNDALKKDFRFVIKQNGGLLAKGRLLGIQFAELMKDDTYMKSSRHAIKMAMKIKDAFLKAGFKPYVDCPTNQQYFVVSDYVEQELGKKYVFDHECKTDAGHWAIRFCTSWGTKEENVETLCKDIAALAGK